MPDPNHSLSERSDSALTVSIDDLGEHWRVDVSRAYVGTKLRATWMAQLLEMRSGSRRWRMVGKHVINDDGPREAISDLLSALDMGVLPR